VQATSDAAVVLLDLHDFKTVNDALGDEAGDAVLIQLGNRLAAGARPGDTCARLGGDQFGVLLDGVGDEEAWDLAHRLLDAVRVGVDVGGQHLQLDAAVGVAFLRDGEGAEEVVRNADLAMGQAKAGGPGGVELFEDGMRHAVLQRLGLKVELRRALAAGEFVPHFQPVVSLTSGRTVSAEALVRWHHPQRGVLPPSAFIELAEESGLIVDIGRSVLLRACAEAVAWPSGPRGPIGVSVNLSAKQLQAEDLVDEVADVLDATGLSASRLTLEITESVLVDDPASAARTLGALKALGVSIALDDFGTGYSSLSYLSRFPVDVLKIDKSFVDAVDMADAGTERALLQAIVGLGRTLELNVVAEGIERPEQRIALQKLGCGLGQGYLFGRPVPSEDLASGLADLTAGV
jgi:diguanylate cyclase (GGDEF)-like protein